jgi:hypothetical protein
MLTFVAITGCKDFWHDPEGSETSENTSSGSDNGSDNGYTPPATPATPTKEPDTVPTITPGTDETTIKIKNGSGKLMTNTILYKYSNFSSVHATDERNIVETEYYLGDVLDLDTVIKAVPRGQYSISVNNGNKLSRSNVFSVWLTQSVIVWFHDITASFEFRILY